MTVQAKHVLAGVASALLGAAVTGSAAAQTPSSSLPAYCAHIPAASQTLPGATTFTYRDTGTRPLAIHIFAPKPSAGRNPAALFFFGGGFRVGDAQSYLELAKAFAAQGYVAAVADYRVLCRDNVTAVGGVEDGEAALAWLRGHARELGIDTRKIVLVGGSAGGLLAASTAMRQPDNAQPLALVLFNPVLDLETGPWAQDQTTVQAIAYSPHRLSVRNLPPTIIFHGAADHTVPVQTSRDFCARAEGSGRICQLVEYKGMDHSFADKRGVDPTLGISMFDDTLRRAVAFLKPLVGGR